MISVEAFRYARFRASLPAAVLVLGLGAGCAPSAAGSPTASFPEKGSPTATASAGSPGAASLVIVGRIVTMDEPAAAQALLIEDGTVAAVGTREAVLGLAGDHVPIIDIGQNVAYPGFIDAHAHWIGDREYYGIGTPAEAMDAAISRGWTSISEQWVNEERLDELRSLAADHALPMRVDAYLALNFGQDFFGDWYASHERGPVGDHLRVQGLKIHLDDGNGTSMLWERGDLRETVVRANDAGWQVSVHAMSAEAQDLILDTYEAALGRTGPNPLHHRVEHALQVTDEQLDRLAAMEIPVVIHPDGAPDWLLDGELLDRIERDPIGDGTASLARWRDLVDAGLRVASASDAPWTFPDLDLVADIGRPVDQIAAGMDGQLRTSPDMPPWLRDQLLTTEQGLRSVTVDAAYAVGDEMRRGHLASGTLGDVTILSGDITSATADEIRNLEVVATIVGGEVVYCSDAVVC